MSTPVVSREDAIRRIRHHAPRIREFGVRRLSLFGSLVRDELRPGSDVDMLVEFEPGAKSYDSFIGLAQFLDDLLGRRVELLTRESLSPHIGPSILREAQDVPVGP